MNIKHSRFVPQIDGWLGDLPERNTPPTAEPTMQDRINFIDENCLELYRPMATIRGIMLVMALVGFYLGLLSLDTVFDSGFGCEYIHFDDFVEKKCDYSAVVFVMYSILVFVLVAYVIRIEMAMPLDAPIRFNRRTRKVYIYTPSFSLKIHKIFRKTGCIVRQWDWDTVNAEVMRRVVATSIALRAQSYLVLNTCKPGTNEVIDRDTLVGPFGTMESFERNWAFICNYMEKGLDSVPKSYIRPERALWVEKAFMVFRLYSTSESAKLLSGTDKTPMWMYIFSPLIIALGFLYIPIGTLDYIGHLVARPPRWPEDIDAESRS